MKLVSSENSYKTICIVVPICPQIAASDGHRLNAQHVYYIYTNCICNLIILTVISQQLLPALHTASPALSRVNLSQLSYRPIYIHMICKVYIQRV